MEISCTKQVRNEEVSQEGEECLTNDKKKEG
jgi:hypothetical protein